MKRYQLIGRKKSIDKSRFQSIPIEYPPYHICSLPYEILLDIFALQDTQTLLKLSLVCKRFKTIIDKTYLYNKLTFKSSRIFKKFAHEHLLIDNHTSSQINFIKEIEFINPLIKENTKFEITIAGSYKIDAESSLNPTWNFDEYISCFSNLLNNSYGLKVLTISQIAPEFAFPIENSLIPSTSFSSIFNKKKIIKNNHRHIEKVELKTQSGWSIPFKLSHISLILSNFDAINELCLTSFIIDDFKLLSLSSTNKYSSNINKLTLNSCLYANTYKRKVPNKKLVSSFIFDNVQILELNNVLSGNDLSIIDFIKLNNKLSTLILDLSSSIFYSKEYSKHIFNYSKYNKFFKLLCSGHGGYSSLKNLVLRNFDLVECFDHSNAHKNDDNDQDVWENPTDNLETLLKYLGCIENVTIVLSKECSVRTVKTCVKCGFTMSTTNDLTVEGLDRVGWTKLLDPLLISNDSKCTVTILNYKLQSLFNRNPTTA
ncbi:uncharacterized protein RJT21DRAFT_35879 [Scheffersomyces amazonensis]|uniref:uncharacterized protein n=1 Tax=Scheffersomyces amazonensis TaxID=1078765 RepID=UPI00315CC577